MKSIFLILLIFFTISCQRETRNNLGVVYNKTLILPPTDDLPVPKSTNNLNIDLVVTDNPVIKGILNQTESINTNSNVADKIDYGSGYDTDQTLFQRLFKGKKNN